MAQKITICHSRKRKELPPHRCSAPNYNQPAYIVNPILSISRFTPLEISRHMAGQGTAASLREDF
jgi:hypothetical protein